MKKYPAALELANLYPEWTKIRTDDQSTGFRLLNSLSRHIDKMDKALFVSGKNAHLVNANLNEIDLTYKVILPTTFTFQKDNTDPLYPVDIAPTVVGNPDTDAFSVTLADDNNLENFWYHSIPNRYSVQRIINNTSHHLLSFLSQNALQYVTLNHHLGAGKLLVETSGGSEYLKIENGELKRASVLIEGITRKGTIEQETLIFPWDSIQFTQKEWKTITCIKILDMESDVTVSIKSANYQNGPYLDSFNQGFSGTRRKTDFFWNLGETSSGVQSLDFVQYATDKWEDLAIGLIDQEVVQSWELLDETLANVSGIDFALEPFSTRAWLVTTDAQLYLFDLSENMTSGIDLLQDVTVGAHVDFDYTSRYLTRGESFSFIPIHSRPIKEIRRYRLWYQTPSGTQYGIKDGASVSFSTNFWVVEQQLERHLTNRISIPLNELGEYLFAIEVEFIDNEVQNNKVLVSTGAKVALAHLDLSSDLGVTVSGIDFDSDQTMWILSDGDHYQINLHTDTMLIDFDRKVIFFKEQYTDVDVTS